MSYDLMVFDPAAAPAGRSAFIAWYQTQTDWDAEHDYYVSRAAQAHCASGSTKWPSSSRL